jgi:hypothetical protein
VSKGQEVFMSNLIDDTLDFVGHELQVARDRVEDFAHALSASVLPSAPEPRQKPPTVKQVHQLEKRIHELEEKLKATQRELGLKKAANEGLMAQANALKAALKAAYPKCPLLGPSGKVWNSGPMAGKQKSRLRVVWEQAFDVEAKRLGAADPMKIRLS